MIMHENDDDGDDVPQDSSESVAVDANENGNIPQDSADSVLADDGIENENEQEQELDPDQVERFCKRYNNMFSFCVSCPNLFFFMFVSDAGNNSVC